LRCALHLKINQPINQLIGKRDVSSAHLHINQSTNNGSDQPQQKEENNNHSRSIRRA